MYNYAVYDRDAVMVDENERPLPLDMSHHYAYTTRQRLPSRMKAFYKYNAMPGMGNIGGGLPCMRFFPFDTLEAQVAKSARWQPTRADTEPNVAGDDGFSAKPPLSDHCATGHVAIPKKAAETNPLKRIDLGTALQYGQVDGFPPLKSFLRQFVRNHIHKATPYRGGPEIVLSVGSTDGFSKALELMVDPWSAERGDDPRDRPGLLCETFVYGNIMTQVAPMGMQMVPVKADDDGMLASGPGGLDDVLGNWDPAKGKRPTMLYMVTMGHNPTGYVLPLSRKADIYAACRTYDVVIVEDEPYWFLQYPSVESEEAKSRGQPLPNQSHPPPPSPTPSATGYPFLDSLVPSFLSIDIDGRVIRLDTFSKSIAPGCRLGWITAQPALIERFTRIAETSSSCPSGFVAATVAALLLGDQPKLAHPAPSTFDGWSMDGWVRWCEGLRGMYERRMVRMCHILDQGSCAVKSWTCLDSNNAPPLLNDQNWCLVSKKTLFSFRWPRGGFFAWLRIHLEAHRLFNAVGSKGIRFGGPTISSALFIFLTTKPYRVIVLPGSMFSPIEEVRKELGWRYVRLTFAAEEEDKVDECTRRFVRGVQAFFGIRTVEELEDLLGQKIATAVAATEGTRGEACLDNLGMMMGC